MHSEPKKLKTIEVEELTERDLEQLSEEELAALEEPEYDPEARWTAAPGGPAFYAYSTNYLVDVEAGVIVDVEAITALRYAWLVR
jgi:hypothetical protein